VGRKFEYNVQDIHENLRRHTRISPLDLVTSAGFIQNGATQSAYVHSFAVAPPWQFNNFFRGWSGTLKYRIFIEYLVADTSDATKIWYPPRVTYVAAPTAPAAVRNLGFMTSNAYSGSTVSTWSAAEDVIRQPNSHWPMPEENVYAVNDRQYYVDVSVPFNTHFNFLPTLGGDFPYENRNGYVIMTTPFTFNNISITVYSAAGDDFRYGVWCPKSQCIYQSLAITSGALPGTRTLVGTTLIQ